MKETFSQSKSIVFKQCIKVLKDMAIDITYSNEKEGIIEAETNGSIWSWGEEIYIKIKSKSGGGTEIKVESTASAQLFSWGKNSSNERTIIEGISERLGR